jgi:4,5-DOPA dioxygenase extradiol
MQPVLFVAHGNPLLLLDEVRAADYRRWGQALLDVQRPDAILSISAHWEDAPFTLGTTETKGLVYDFYGFPEALYAARYPAPGAPALADRVEELLGEAGHAVRRSDRGHDHGTWVPLVHMFPTADIPLLQLSMPKDLSPAALQDAGRALAPLREENVLVLGSGNLTHNLRTLDRADRSPPPAWAETFDGWMAKVLVERDWATLAQAPERGPAYAHAHPTDEHFRPIHVVAGMSRGADALSTPIEGFEYGSISRRSVQLG